MKLEQNARDQLNARESTDDKSATGFSFESDWLNMWRDFFLTQSKTKTIPACFRHLIGCIDSIIIGHVRSSAKTEKIK